MNSKKNSFKRVAAGALAVLTVAAYTTPVANVGGLPTFVANAEELKPVTTERVVLDWAGTVYDVAKGSTYLTSFKINGTAQTGLTATDNQKFQSGSRVELTSTVPLAFSFGTTNEKIKELTIAGSAKYKNYKYDATEKLFISPEANERNMTADELAEALLEEAGFDIDTDETFTKRSAWNVENPNAITEDDYKTLTVNFYAKETVKDGNYTYTFVMPADNIENEAGVFDTLKVATIPQKFAVKYYRSESDRTNKNDNNEAAPIYWEDKVNDTAFEGDGYFKGMTVSSRDKENTTTTLTALDQAQQDLKPQILGDTVTVTCANPFAVHVNDNDPTVHWINPDITYDATDKVFKTSFTMPKSKTDDPVQIDVVKIDEQYTYTSKDGKLLATTKSGSIKNAEAASIIAKVDDKAISGAVENGKQVVVSATVAEKLGTFKELKVTKGIDVVGTINAEQFNANPNANIVIGGNAGTYNVAYTVTGNDGKDYVVSYSFSIAAKSALTAENVTLALSAKKNNQPVNQNDLEGILADNVNITNLAGKTGQTATYMIASGKAAEVQKAGYQFTVTPTVIADAELVSKDDNEAVYDYYVEGNVSGSKLGYTYTFTIYIVNPEYGGSATKPKTITMTWEIVDYDEYPQWNVEAFANGSIESIDKLEDEIYAKAASNGAARDLRKSSEIRYQWIEGSGALRTNEIQDELDEFHDGLPSEIGNYTVYVIYKDVVKSTVRVNISKYALNIFADKSDLTTTYGKKFELKKPTIQKNSAGKTVKVNVSDLWCIVYKVKTNADGEPLMYIKDENGEKTGTEAWDGKSTDFVIAGFKIFDSIEEVGQLPAGYYAIEFCGTVDDENYSVSMDKPQLLTVNKKNITDSSIVILVDPFTYDSKQHDVVKDGAFTVRDTDFTPEDDIDPVTNEPYVDPLNNKYDISAKFKMTEGGKRTAAGTYDCTFKLVSDDDNYEGSAVDSNWYITHKEAEKANVDAGLTWDDERSTLYDNGRIHVEITRNADDKIRKDNEVAKIAKFGVLFDKTGKLAAPAEYGVDYSKVNIDAIKQAQNEEALAAALANANDKQKEKYLAEKMLEYGNKAFGEGGYTKTTSTTCASQTYKANIEVSDVNTGMWLRPYVLYEDGTVSYGDIKYLDLTHEAIDHLQLQMAELGDNGKATRKADLTAAQTKTLKKTMQYVKTGYNVVENKFYAYTSYIDLETAGFTNVAQVADFGVVVDRSAKVAAPGKKDNGNFKKYAEMDAEVKAAVDKSLRIGATKGLVVGHYKKDNPVLKENEYAASIKLGNAATGCWVRPYIDLGNDLVIYADPVYIPSASEYYGENAAGTLNTVWENNSCQRLIFTQVETANSRIGDRVVNEQNIIGVATKAGVEAKDVEVVKTGVIADKKNLLKKPTVEKEYVNPTNETESRKYIELDPNAPFNTQMVLGAGFIDGKKSSDFGQFYTAKISPKDQNDISVRTYTVYNIKGVEVTVYGPVKTYEFSDDKGRVVDSRGYNYDGETDIHEIGGLN